MATVTDSREHIITAIIITITAAQDLPADTITTVHRIAVHRVVIIITDLRDRAVITTIEARARIAVALPPEKEVKPNASPKES